MTIQRLEDAPNLASDAPLFEKQKHIKYWLRCFRSPLPTQYQQNDSHLLALTFFTVSALDVLGVLFTQTTNEERIACIDSIYLCQHPDGGFRGSLGTNIGSRRNDANRYWDPANIGAAYFAVCSLMVLGDDLTRVNKPGMMRLLRRLQRGDGSFGEYLSYDGSVEGGMDTRYGYFAMSLRWIFRGYLDGPVYAVDDINLKQYLECIRRSQSYDGGISEEPFHEGHAGFAYCAVASLAFVGCLPRDLTATGQPAVLSAPSELIEWLLDRLTTAIEEEDDDTDEEILPAGSDESLPTLLSEATKDSDPPSQASSFTKLRSTPLVEAQSKGIVIPRKADQMLVGRPFVRWTGFSGRCNKIADTCYAWWAGATLKMLNGLDLIDPAPLRRYLLAKTQHMIVGGFGKFPEDPPDIYHSYLGLIALAILGVGRSQEAVLGPHLEDIDIKEIRHELGDRVAEKLDGDTDNLREVDAALALSRRARLWLERLEWRQVLMANGIPRT